MLKITHKKNAVSPIIATVLLLTFAVVLGTIILNFTTDTTNDLVGTADYNIEAGKCSTEVSLKILEVSNTDMICYNRSSSNNFEFILENQGNLGIDGVNVFLLDSDNNIKTTNILRTVSSHNTSRFNFSAQYTDTGASFVFPPIKVLIAPIIKTDDLKQIICDDNKIDIEEIEQCT